MGIFRCDHEVSKPNSTTVNYDSAFIGYDLRYGARLVVKGFCDHCKALVCLEKFVQDYNLYLWLKEEEEKKEVPKNAQT
jgi:hypothetical protein